MSDLGPGPSVSNGVEALQLLEHEQGWGFVLYLIIFYYYFKYGQLCLYKNICVLNLVFMGTISM